MNTSLLDSLPFNNQEFLEQRQVDYLDLTFLKKIRADQKNLGKTFYQIAQLIDKLNPKGILPHFNVVTGSERPLLLPELKGDNLPIFIAADRQGILWVRPVYVVNGLKQPQTARDGSADNIVTTDITAIDVASFLYGFDGTDWDRLRTLVDNADNLVAGNPGHLGVMAKLLGFDGTDWDRLRVGATNSDAVATLTTGVLHNMAHLFGFNGTTYDRIRSQGNNADNLATVTLGNLNTNCFLYGFDGTTWDRLQSGDTSADARATNSARILQVQSNPMGFNGSTWDRLRTVVDNADNSAANTTGNLGVMAKLMGFDGTNWDRLRTVSASNQATTSSLPGVQLVAQNGNWSEFSFPATNTVATVTRAAAGAGLRHILTSLHFSLAGAAAAAAGIVQCVVRDGATAVGTVIWSGVLTAPITGIGEISLSGLSLPGTANTAMTIEFAAAGGAGTQEAVTMTGYTVV